MAGVVPVVLFVLLIALALGRNLVRKESLESDLIESGEQLRNMIESVKDAIVTMDFDGRVLMFNRAAASLFGVAADHVIGKRILDVLADWLPAEQLAVLANCLLPRPGCCGYRRRY